MKRLLVLALCVAALPAAAHPGHEAAGFAAGFAHPFTGLDHLLAMLAVGLWSRQQRLDKALPLAGMPAACLLAMAAGALIQLNLPWLETGIAATVVLLGLLAAGAVRLPAGAAIAMVALFAFLHGQAHGRELPGLAAAAGFLLASASLLIAGGALARLKLDRVAGAAIGAAGLCLLAGVA